MLSVLRRRSSLQGAESALLDCLLRVVSPELREAIEKQVSCISKIQRLPGGSEIDVYHRTSGSCKSVPKLDLGGSEFCIATVDFVFGSSMTKQRGFVSIWVVNGMLFSFELDPPVCKLYKHHCYETKIELHESIGEVSVKCVG